MSVLPECLYTIPKVEKYLDYFWTSIQPIEPTRQNIFRCRLCEKNVASYRALQFHIRNHEFISRVIDDFILEGVESILTEESIEEDSLEDVASVSECREKALNDSANIEASSDKFDLNNNVENKSANSPKLSPVSDTVKSVVELAKCEQVAAETESGLQRITSEQVTDANPDSALIEHENAEKQADVDHVASVENADSMKSTSVESGDESRNSRVITEDSDVFRDVGIASTDKEQRGDVEENCERKQYSLRKRMRLDSNSSSYSSEGCKRSLSQDILTQKTMKSDEIDMVETFGESNFEPLTGHIPVNSVMTTQSDSKDVQSVESNELSDFESLSVRKVDDNGQASDDWMVPEEPKKTLPENAGDAAEKTSPGRKQYALRKRVRLDSAFNGSEESRSALEDAASKKKSVKFSEIDMVETIGKITKAMLLASNAESSFELPHQLKFPESILSSGNVHDCTAESGSDSETEICPECPEVFDEYFPYVRHIIEKHNISAKCQFCDVPSLSVLAYRRHVFDEHPVMFHTQSRPGKSLDFLRVCRFCDEKIKGNAEAMMKHVNSHCEYVCKDCFKGFSTASTLNRHKSVHD